MVRTALRSRSGGTVTTVQLADRTGIVAASLPRQRGDDDPADRATAPLPVATVAEPVRVPPRPARRYWILAAAAIVFMMVGWAGGGMFGVPYGNDPDPSVETFSASGNAFEAAPPAQPPVIAAPTPPIAAPPPEPVAPKVKPVRTKQKQADTESASSRRSTQSQASEPDFRADVDTSAPAPKPADLARDQLLQAIQPMLDAMRQSSLRDHDGH